MLILDIGCGCGLLTLILSEKWNVIGINVNKDRLNIARKIVKIDFKEKFDLILALDILEHLKYPNKSLKKIHNHLKSNGLLIVSIPNKSSFWEVLNLFLKLEEHKHYWKPNEFKILLQKYGFELIDFYPRPMFGESLGFLPFYKNFLLVDILLGKMTPAIATGWVFAFRKIS
ncbi:MAG: class I SAM-dependent methyltransferase [Candidatus Aenigmarchaeota archaeon]|nr:class I SAM-dependent methyltransferase [Candidatus Aenigmarchaeota archaeon]